MTVLLEYQYCIWYVNKSVNKSNFLVCEQTQFKIHNKKFHWWICLNPTILKIHFSNLSILTQTTKQFHKLNCLTHIFGQNAFHMPIFLWVWNFLKQTDKILAPRVNEQLIRCLLPQKLPLSKHHQVFAAAEAVCSRRSCHWVSTIFRHGIFLWVLTFITNQ